MVSAVSSWRTALRRERCFPASVDGPVLLSAFHRLASDCLQDVMPRSRLASFRNSASAGQYRPPDQPSLGRAGDACAATASERQLLDQCPAISTTRLHHCSGEPRDDDLCTKEPWNSSLTFLPSARLCMKRRWCASDGCRPQIKQGRVATNLIAVTKPPRLGRTAPAGAEVS
jgi:hypothetical protein